MNTNAKQNNSIKILRALRSRGEISETQFRGQAKATKRTTVRSIRHRERREIEEALYGERESFVDYRSGLPKGSLTL